MILEQKGYQNQEIIENLELVFMVSKICKKQKGKKNTVFLNLAHDSIECR